MEEKYIKFYENFHKAFDGKSNHCSNLISHGGVVWNRELLIFIFKDSMARLIS
tara:strand:+ start:2040 stop:2198 length:159 start_codon:yes stop_codon:yes gene_type:complete